MHEEVEHAQVCHTKLSLLTVRADLDVLDMKLVHIELH